MNKKLILLILVLPLFLMLSIYTSTNSVGLNVKVPVSNIEVTDEKVVYLNLDNEEKHYVNYSVYPITASNKQVVFSAEQFGSERFAELEYKDGYIIPKSVGSAKVYLTTVDGGYKDSFIVTVESVGLQSIECSVEQTGLMVGTSTRIQTTFVPENFSNKELNYSSSNTAVATVSDKGLIRGVGKGQAVITVSSQANSSIKDTIVVDVYNEDIMDLAQSEVFTIDTVGSIGISVNTLEEFEIDYALYDTNNNLLNTSIFENAQFDVNGSQVTFNYTLKADFTGSAIIKFTITTDNEIREPFSRECVLHKVNELQASYDSDEVLGYTTGATFALHNLISVNPENAEVVYEVEISDPSNPILEVVEASNKIRLKAIKPGVANVKIKVISSNLSQSVTLKDKKIVVLPKGLIIEQSTKTFGIEDVWTVGKTEADGSASTCKLNFITSTEVGSNFSQNFSYVTNLPNKVVVAPDGTINILDDQFNGLVDVYAKFESDGFSVTSQPYSFRAVGNGVNVRCFEDLYNLTKLQKVVVLQNEIKQDFGFDLNGNAIYNEQTVEKIKSTYDITHYKNLGKEQDAVVKVLISFKEDVYGNGYQINAHNVAYGLDSTDALKDSALFRGPRNFVSLTDSEGSAMSVKAQDNICFAVYENVSLNNVELKSCDLKADPNGNYDLTDLDYVGTTVEVLGDNVNINYCRLTNGRTVLRVFGDANDNTKVINLNIKNSVLSFAREFIVRIGSNCFVDGTKEDPSPYIDQNEKYTFPAQKTYETLTEAQKADYENKYIKTFVNIKNSVLKDSGLFCIGMDSHFSGTALADGSGFLGGLISSWYDLAKTSYGAKLTFEGDVRMYGWKDVEEIDSSTLIQVDLAENIKIEDFEFGDMKFDIKELIKDLANDPEKTYLNRIVYKKDGKQFVHGGIAFFGGGKNYSIFDINDYDFKILNGYEIRLSDINKTELQLAAGNEAFYFLLNDSTTQGFLPDDQASLLADASGAAYSPIYLKD